MLRIKYFKFIGYLFITMFILGALADLIYLISSIAPLIRTGQILLVVLLIILFIFSITVGPAMGLLFLTLASLLEKETPEPILHTNVVKHVVNNNEEHKLPMKRVKEEVREYKQKEDAKDTTQVAGYNKVSIQNGMIIVDNSSYNLKYVQNITVEDNKVMFSFYSKKVVIECETNLEIEKLYDILINAKNMANYRNV